MDGALLDRLAGVPDRLAAAAPGAPAAAAGEWSPSDVVRHLIAVEEEVWHVRLRQLATEDHPIWAWAEPDRWQGEPDASLDRLLEVHRVARAATVATLDAFDDADWARTGTHATYGELGVAALVEKAADHDEEHLASLQG
ncbi:MAG TPA: DinB family protein [Patescibacteria group bacterium]|nr:DinB family protein [Patescibacteria group bacterium]